MRDEFGRLMPPPPPPAVKVKYGRGGRRKRHGKRQRQMRESEALDRIIWEAHEEFTRDFMEARRIVRQAVPWLADMVDVIVGGTGGLL